MGVSAIAIAAVEITGFVEIYKVCRASKVLTSCVLYALRRSAGRAESCGIYGETVWLKSAASSMLLRIGRALMALTTLSTTLSVA